jgi:hypothetical protein
MTSLRKHFFLACLALVSSLCHPSLAVAGIYEDLRWAVEDNNITDITRLLAKGADPDTPDEQGNTLLMVAVGHKNADLVDLLVNAGAKLNLRNRRGETAIMLASYRGFGDIVEKLYLKGAEINHPGWNPLIYAASGGHVGIIRLLLDGGVPINSVSDNGTTALMMAARGNHVEAVKVLLDRGADPNLRNEWGKTAMDWALSKNNRDIEELLKMKRAGQ